MHVSSLIFVVGGAWLLQFALTFLQIRHYRTAMRGLVNQYRNADGFYLFSGVARKALGSGAIALVVVNENVVIENCQILSGITVFAKFTGASEYVGMPIDQAIKLSDLTLQKKSHLPSKKQSIARAIKMACENAMRSHNEIVPNLPN